MRNTIYALATQAKANHQTDAKIIGLKLGETGFWPIYTQATVEDLNPPGTTPEVIQAAVFGSVFGWHVPAAKAAFDFLHQQP